MIVKSMVVGDTNVIMTFKISPYDSPLDYRLFVNSVEKQSLVFSEEVCIVEIDPLNTGDTIEVKNFYNETYGAILSFIYNDNTFSKLYNPTFLKTYKEEINIIPKYLTTTIFGNCPSAVQTWSGINLSLEFLNDYNRGFEEGMIIGQII